MSKILLVEDDELSRDMLRRRLGRKGYDVIEAVDGSQVLDIVRSEHPDIVLMDMSLPVIDGWTVTRMLKSTAETASTPVIALTAHAMQQDRERALEAGCDDYETKPIEFAQLVEK